MKGFFVYKHFNKKDECIYIGLTTNMRKRQGDHYSVSRHGNKIHRIEYADVDSGLKMAFYELYYINKIKPKYNMAMTYDGDLSFINLPELRFKEYRYDYKAMTNNITGQKHIHLTSSSRYRVQLCRNKKNINVGNFNTLEEAMIARDAWLVENVM